MIPILALLVSASACNRQEDPSEATPAAAAQSQQSRAAFAVAGKADQPWATAEPNDDGYALAAPDGSKIGKLSVGADRVKLKNASGATTAKVKAKDYGFKIYSDDETAVAKVKRKGAGFKLKGADDSELGELATKGAGGTVGGSAVTVTNKDGSLVVERDGAQVGAVDARFGEKAASFLGATEFSFEQRVAAMVFVAEVSK